VKLNFALDQVDWQKTDGLVPAVIQDATTQRVLMLGYVNRDSLAATLTSGDMTFYSRSRQQLWRKGETSGNVLKVVSLALDCDGDTLLVAVHPHGPACHRGTETCFDDGEAVAAGAAAAPVQVTDQAMDQATFQATDQVTGDLNFLAELTQIIDERAAAVDDQTSYTRKLLAAGVRRQAQKVGEEGVEVALAAVVQDDQALLGEAADLVYHLMVLLKGRGLALKDVCQVLAARHK
jgi:phosphoribosyl-ATP pyrophosphohydrolase/phosphoribosyl-AMP cyclohydrolase